ncbi:Solute carrier family 43 member 3 [Schistosoma japonicum]|uniref:Solute carrier family 43 member 3 n=1 Tax=Schistosoma japonicum TaxID=6182 RepID=A0A4Z2D1K5_SCHJA|nr:Solute carrier family 43 member 3 [Schistosoma japonicum]KAH8860229.1 Solute carrier family 43 member 3 [Schistosoma japonicum]TNN10376.1 Solute carrier family 43 member 3 [Schistosoma japonicum]TNN10377.1 Solute carrier family 43 member 3 [Schistosoma japonicum]
MGLCQRLDSFCQSKTRKWVGIIVGILELFWFGGYYYGFNSLIPAWKSLGVSAYNCSDTTNTCLYNDSMFGNGFVVWVVIQMCLISFAGIFMDKVGLRAMKLVAISMYCIGTLLFSFLYGGLEPLYYIAGILVAIGSTSNLISNHHISSMFPKYRGFVISLLSGAFDSSTLITFILSETYTQFSLQKSFIILALASLCVGLFMALFILTTKSDDMKKFASHFKDTATSNDDEAEQERLSHGCAENGENMSSTDKETKNTDISKRINMIVDIRYQSLKDCIISLPFLLITLWFTLGLFRFSTFLGQLQRLINELFPNDITTIDHLLQISSAFSMCGFLAAPITGFILDASQAYCRRKIVRNIDNIGSDHQDKNRIYYMHIFGLAPALLVMAFCAILASCLIFVPNRVAFYIAFIFFVMLRSLLFSTSVSFCFVAFPVNYFGTVCGALNSIGGIFSLLQYAFQYTSSAKVANIIITIFSVGLFIPPIILFKMK